MSSTTNIPAVYVTGLISQTLRVLEGLEDLSVLLDSLAEIDLVDPCDEGQPSHMTSRPYVQSSPGNDWSARISPPKLTNFNSLYT